MPQTAAPTALPKTLGQLRTSKFTPQLVSRSVKDELRDNLIARLQSGLLAAARTRNTHAASEMQAMLDDLS